MGTLRSFILGKRDFPWRMRISFATDISRALAYLHAREVNDLLQNQILRCAMLISS